jgi:hypothetical protein
MDIRLKTSTSWWVIALCLAAGLAAGFLIGRKSFVTGERVRVTDMPEVAGVVSTLTPVDEIKPSAAVLPLRRDTVTVNDTVRIVEHVDTAAIISSYELRRKYSELLFDRPDLGRLNIEFDVQYNRADSLRYTFIPMRTEVTRTVKAAIEPFVYIEGSTLGYAGIGAGLYYGKWGASLKYERELSSVGRRGVGFGLNYRF